MNDDDKSNAWTFEVQLDVEAEKPIIIEKQKTKIVTKKKTALPVDVDEEKNLELDLRFITPIKPKVEVKTISRPTTKIEKIFNIKPISETIVFASLVKRVTAQFIDLLVFFTLFILSAYFVPMGIKVCQFFMERAKLKFAYSMMTTSQLVQLAILTLYVFIVFVVFLSITNTSVGKKVMGLEVRGSEQYPLPVMKAFLREMIFKPLSFLTFVGILYAWVNPAKRTLHDLLSSTIVVEKK
jgi:uncharacterized RDD family membrane protein YckC